jgi:hypothetical protein
VKENFEWLELPLPKLPGNPMNGKKKPFGPCHDQEFQNFKNDCVHGEDSLVFRPWIEFSPVR